MSPYQIYYPALVLTVLALVLALAIALAIIAICSPTTAAAAALVITLAITFIITVCCDSPLPCDIGNTCIDCWTIYDILYIIFIVITCKYLWVYPLDAKAQPRLITELPCDDLESQVTLPTDLPMGKPVKIHGLPGVTLILIQWVQWAHHIPGPQLPSSQPMLRDHKMMHVVWSTLCHPQHHWRHSLQLTEPTALQWCSSQRIK